LAAAAAAVGIFAFARFDRLHVRDDRLVGAV
jgi:hypothetical protein